MGLYRSPTGAIEEIDDDRASSAVAGGYTPITSAQAGAPVEHEDRGVLGTINAGASSVLSGATLGLSDVALRGILNRGQMDRLVTEREANPITSMVGQAAGTILPAVVAPESLLGKAPAGILSRATAPLIERGGASALLGGGIEGAAQNAGAYLSDVALGKRDLSAEGVAGALGGGFAFGVGGGAVAMGIEKGSIAARRMFAHVADGGERAANEAEQAWLTQYQSTVETHDAAVDAAKAQLASARATREQAGLARDRASAATADIRAIAPDLDAAHAHATGLDEKIAAIEAASHPQVKAGGIEDLERLITEHYAAKTELDDLLRNIDQPDIGGAPVVDRVPVGEFSEPGVAPVTEPATAAAPVRLDRYQAAAASSDLQSQLDPKIQDAIYEYEPKAVREKLSRRNCANGACDTVEPEFREMTDGLSRHRIDLTTDAGIAEAKRLYHMTDDQVASMVRFNNGRMKRLGVATEDMFHQISVTSDGIAIDWTANQFNKLPVPYVFRLRPASEPVSDSLTGLLRGTQEKLTDSVPAVIRDDEFKAMQSAFESNLTPAEDRHLTTYVNSTYKDLNRGLRHGEIRNGREKILYAIDSALEKSSMPRRTTLYRGLTGKDAEQFSNLGVGDRFTELAYSSTSTNPNVFKREVNLHIDVPKGYQAAPIPSSIDEKEFLLRRNTRYEVTSIVDDGKAKTINVRVVDSDPPPRIADMVSNKTGRQPDAPPIRIEKAAAPPPATDSLTGLLRGTQEKLAAGENINAIGAPARGEYAAAKAGKRQQWLERNSPIAKDEAVANAAIVDDIARVAPAITKYERKSAELVEALGDAAPPMAKEQAAAFRAAEDDADRKMMDRTTRAVDDGVERVGIDRRPSANPPAKQRLEAAKRDQMKANAAYQNARVGETEAKIGVRNATEARNAIPDPPVAAPTGATAPTSLFGNLATAVGVAGEFGVPGIPNPDEIPVIGPLLGMYLKYRALKATVGRFVGRVSASGDSRAAALAARTKDRIATAIDRSLGLLASPKVRVAAVAASTAIGKRIFDDGEPDAGKDATPQHQAGVRIREIIAANTRPELISAMVRKEMHGVADPDLIASAEQHLIARFAHLAGVIPNPPPDNEYAKRPWVPSQQATHELNQRLAVIHDPEHGLTARSPAAADTFRAAYPLLYEMAKNRLIQRVGDMTEAMPRSERLRVGALFQLPIDISLDPSHIAIVRAPAKPDVPPPAPVGMSVDGISKMYSPTRI